MPATQPIPKITDHKPLACPSCSTTMVLTQIKPDTPGYETLTFYCLRCGNTEIKDFKVR
jgi:C4-type Zn-finger protein